MTKIIMIIVVLAGVTLMIGCVEKTVKKPVQGEQCRWHTTVTPDGIEVKVCDPRIEAGKIVIDYMLKNVGDKPVCRVAVAKNSYKTIFKPFMVCR